MQSRISRVETRPGALFLLFTPSNSVSGVVCGRLLGNKRGRKKFYLPAFLHCIASFLSTELPQLEVLGRLWRKTSVSSGERHLVENSICPGVWVGTLLDWLHKWLTDCNIFSHFKMENWKTWSCGGLVFGKTCPCSVVSLYSNLVYFSTLECKCIWGY